MTAGRWKRHEREVARMFGVERNHSDYVTHTDIHTDKYAIEHKLRKQLPAWLHKAMQQAVDDARGRTPIVVLTEASAGHKAIRYVVIELENFLDGTQAVLHEGDAG